jgi:hypothetical protein
MPESIGFPQRSLQQPPRQPQARGARQTTLVEENDDEALRKRFADRMQIRKTQAVEEPNWAWLGITLLSVALALGLGVGLGGGLVAVGIGLGWLSVALVALVWHDLERFYAFWQQNSR